MVAQSTPRPSLCLNCGFEAEQGEWDSVDAPPLGQMTQCPECKSTNIMSRA
jgi:predicted Zn-ribbon and HTH transcriptional regulator